jgi:DNA mismatch repair protein MutS2
MTRQDLFRSSLDQLEYHRVLEHIAGFAASSLGVEHISGLMPLSDEEAIRHDLRMVAEMRYMIERGEELPLHGVYDIRNALALAKISGNYLGGEDFLAILTTLQSLRKVSEFFRSRRSNCPLLFELTEDVHTNPLLERHIQDAIDDIGQVRDNASRELARIRREIIVVGRSSTSLRHCASGWTRFCAVWPMKNLSPTSM